MSAQSDLEKKKNLGNIVKILVFMRPYYLRLYSLLGLTILLSVLAMIPPIVMTSSPTLRDSLISLSALSFFLCGLIIMK